MIARSPVLFSYKEIMMVITRFENRKHEYICKYCGSALQVNLVDEIGARRQRVKRKMFCSKLCAKRYKQAREKAGAANKIHS